MEFEERAGWYPEEHYSSSARVKGSDVTRCGRKVKEEQEKVRAPAFANCR